MAPDLFELLSAYLDDELPPAERQKVEHLLRENPEAHKVFLRLQRLQGMTNTLSSADPIHPAQISERVFRRLDQQRWQTGSWAAAAVLLVVFAGSLAQRPQQMPPIVAVARAPGLRPPAPGVVEVAARSYLLEDPAPQDAYAVLLERDSFTPLAAEP